MTSLIEETSSRLLPRVVLIACGSFSPPTPMHLRMFEIARDHFALNGICEVIGGIVSPTHDNYGKKGLASAKHRCTMVKLALQSSNWIRLSEWETQQDTWSRTQAVLHHHQNFMNNQIQIENGNNGDFVPDWVPSSLHQRKDPVQLKLLCGADLLQSFAVPGLWLDSDVEDIVGNHGLVVITRSSTNPEKFIFDSDILSKYQRNINLITNWVPNEVSSTMIRRLLSRGQSVKYLLDDLVVNYIIENGLYESKRDKIIERIAQTDMVRFNQLYRRTFTFNGNDLLDKTDTIDAHASETVQQHTVQATTKNTSCSSKRDIISKTTWSSTDQTKCLSPLKAVVPVNEPSESSLVNEHAVQEDKMKSKKVKMA